MTPKEKAQELIEKHLIAYDIEPIAIKCALITVNEMLKESVLPIISHRTDSYKTAEDFNKNFTNIKYQIDNFIISKYSYWQGVKHELEEIWEQY